MMMMMRQQQHKQPVVVGRTTTTTAGGGFSLLLPLLLVLFVLTDTSHGLPWYREQIPNGFRVPNPEPQGGVWAGVGHSNIGGGSKILNPFGQDFAANGFEWTIELCQKDSDGDGRSNGQELGDPNCQWQYNGGGQEQEQPSHPAESHPGIVDDPPTRSSNHTTSPILLLDSCDTYEPPQDAIEVTVQFTSPNVLTASNNRTTYMCEQLSLTELPMDNVLSYSLVRSNIVNNNPNILHHFGVYECDIPTFSSDGYKIGQGPYECTGMESSCSPLVAWALGRLPTCEPSNVGIDFEFPSGGGRKVLKLEAHYDNALLQDEIDQSGMVLTVTPTLRPHSSGLVRFGLGLPDANFNLLPQEQEQQNHTTTTTTTVVSTVVGTCPGQVTNKLPHPIWAYAFFPHMHYLGISMITEQYRCGVKIGDIGHVQKFEFDNQQLYPFSKPIKILPGDVLRTTCSYNITTSTNASTSTIIQGGTKTTDEMCYNFIYYYPKLPTIIKLGGNVDDDDDTTIRDFFTTCYAFDNGIKSQWLPLMGGAIPTHTTPFATLNNGIGGWKVELNYTSDPTVIVNSCCNDNDATTTTSASDGSQPSSCEDAYLSDLNGPCGEHQDCKSRYCESSLCQEDPYTTTPPPTIAPSLAPSSSSGRVVSSSAAAGANLVIAKGTQQSYCLLLLIAGLWWPIF